jgi:long-chain fatty acid transport protein
MKCLGLLLVAATAHAGGMDLPVHGVREVARAGALVAGAEDPDAMWGNPAGLAHLVGTKTFLVGVTYLDQTVDYTRIDSGGTTMPTVSNQSPGFPIPTIAVTYGIGDRLVVGAGIGAPYAALHRYPVDGTQRYASISLAESRMAIVTLAAAYAITPRLRVGATLEDLISTLNSRVVLASCPGQTVCAPEDPEFDADTKIVQTDVWSPTGSLGVQWDAHPLVTLGAAVHAPAKIDGDGKLQTRLPSSGFFEGAMVVGDRASLAFTLPASVRAGVEVRPDPHVRVEVAVTAELWSMHDAITITPHGVEIDNVPGVGTYVVGPSVIPRHYKNSYAPSIGGEYRFGKAMIGAGYAYETAAAPRGYVSVLTVDSAKHIIGLGGAYAIGGGELGASLGFVKLVDVSVPLADARVPELTPVRDQPADVYVNAGTYRSTYLLGGLRFSRPL